MAAPTIEGYEDKELELQVREVYPVIYKIIAGVQDEAGRLEAFMKGGKAKSTLSQRVGPGDFSRNEYTFISNMLQSEFLSDLSTTKQLHTNGLVNGTAPQYDTPMKREGDVTRSFSDQMRLHFFTDVLLPETITRLTMRRYNLSYAEADLRVLEGTRDGVTDTWWVDDVLAARESFLYARSLQ